MAEKSILGLPVEMVDNILSHLPERYQAEARLVCKEFDYHLQPKVFRRVSLNLCHNTRHSILNSKLNTFIREYDVCGYPAADFTRYLEIDKWYPANSNGTTFGTRYNPQRAKDLLDILSEFEKLKGVNWTLGAIVDPAFAQRLMNVLTESELLEEFRLKFESTPPRFDALHNLRRLVIQADLNFEEAVDALAQVQHVVGKCPNLRCLGLDFTWQKDWPSDPQHQLDPFRFISKRDSLPLEHLMIKGGWNLRLDESLWRNIRNLKSLEIGDAGFLFKEQEQNLNQFWKGMEDNQIWLRKIKVPIMSVALLEYMASYHGIEELIVERTVHNEDESTEMAKMFFKGVLPRHVRSLRVLRLKEYFESAWCFDRKAVKVLQNSRRLEKLTIPIVGPEKMSMDTFLNDLSCIKTLKHLEIPDLFPREFRDTRDMEKFHEWAREHFDDFTSVVQVWPCPNYPDFITFGGVLLKHVRETRTSMPYYKRFNWMPQEEQSNAAKIDMFFIDGDHVVRPPTRFYR